MQRYHSAQGTGRGVGHTITSEQYGREAMYPAEEGYGYWVLYQDAIEEIEQAKGRAFEAGKRSGLAVPCSDCFNDGLAKGRAEGQTKLDAYIAADKAPSEQSDLDAARSAGFDEGHKAAFESVLADEIRATFAKANSGAALNDETWRRMQEFSSKQADRIAARDQTDTRTNQLLNELYHDRARLERVVEDAVELARQASDMMAGTEVTEYEDTAEWHYTTGLLRQFADTHGEMT